MPICKTIRRKNRSVCIGDLRDKIEVQVRTLTPPGSSVDFSESFTDTVKVSAMVETRNGVEIFDGTNIKGVATHYFYIRYRANLTAESWVKFKSKYFNILDTQNLEERDEFILLRCSVRGTTSNQANFA